MDNFFTLQTITLRLIKRGSFDLLSDPEFATLDPIDQRIVRTRVRFSLLQES
jgi:hypothetical protein